MYRMNVKNFKDTRKSNGFLPDSQEQIDIEGRRLEARLERGYLLCYALVRTYACPHLLLFYRLLHGHTE